MPAWLHLALHGPIVALHVTGPTKREREWDRSGLIDILSSLVPMASQIFLFFLFLFFFSLAKETKLISLLSCTQNLLRWHWLVVMHYGSVFRIEFSYTDRVRHNFVRLVRFRNSRYSVSLRSFSCLALPFSLSFSYSNVKVKNGWGVFWPFSSLSSTTTQYSELQRRPNNIYKGGKKVRLCRNATVSHALQMKFKK
jgi:hypothetical protein